LLLVCNQSFKLLTHNCQTLLAGGESEQLLNPGYWFFSTLPDRVLAAGQAAPMAGRVAVG
jgi:hypothetical protein